MGLTQKAIRKLGLGDTASRLLAPCFRDGAPLPSPEEAHAFLEKLCALTGKAPVCAAAVPPLGLRRTLILILFCPSIMSSAIFPPVWTQFSIRSVLSASA